MTESTPQNAMTPERQAEIKAGSPLTADEQKAKADQARAQPSGFPNKS